MTVSNRLSTTRDSPAVVAEAVVDVGEVTDSVVAVVAISGDAAAAAVTTGADVDEVDSEASRVTKAQMAPMEPRLLLQASDYLASQYCFSRSLTPNVLAVFID